jgi:hypothetical protein
MKGPRSQNLILASTSNCDHQFGMPVGHGRAKIVAISHHKFIRVARSSGIYTISLEQGTVFTY